MGDARRLLFDEVDRQIESDSSILQGGTLKIRSIVSGSSINTFWQVLYCNQSYARAAGLVAYVLCHTRIGLLCKRDAKNLWTGAGVRYSERVSRAGYANRVYETRPREEKGER